METTGQLRRATLCAALCLAAFSATSGAAQPLFPSPFHVTREVDDPVSGKTRQSEEYYAADRVVSVAGDRTVIADYARGELTEIDRAKSTYSVTWFDAVAAARKGRSVKLAAAGEGPRVERHGRERRLGSEVELFTGIDKQASLEAEIAVDPGVTLTRGAFDVLVHAAHPNPGGAASDLVRLAARRPGAQSTALAERSAEPSETYALPIDETFRWRISGRTIVLQNRIVHIDNATVPAVALSIPLGAQQVESRRLRTARAAAELDSLRPPSGFASAPHH